MQKSVPPPDFIFTAVNLTQSQAQTCPSFCDPVDAVFLAMEPHFSCAQRLFGSHRETRGGALENQKKMFSFVII